MSYTVQLPLFEGPFDLLLFFIERDELNIYDIPIAQVTNDFLAYLQQLEKLNLDVASEFILVAATLMRIKAKMLLPRPELDEKGNEIDPRDELVAHLLEYRRYKSVIGTLATLETDRQSMEARGNLAAELATLASQQGVELELQTLDLFKLLRVYQRVMRRFADEQARPVHQIVPYPYTVEGQKDFLRNYILQEKRVDFSAIIALRPTRIAVIFNFIAVLELLQAGEWRITFGEGYNDFSLEYAPPESLEGESAESVINS
ncbi:MAG: segregation/condensation protein A [Bernardetiaceae bacterium]|jgi:segregation and condensation protein A|nr:segregation/condensation protein A [Bernardetiaceae bacterium]